MILINNPNLKESLIKMIKKKIYNYLYLKMLLQNNLNPNLKILISINLPVNLNRVKDKDKALIHNNFIL